MEEAMAEEAAQLDRNAYRAAIMATAGVSRDYEAMARSIAGWLEGRLGSDVTVANLRVPQGAGLANETLLFEAGYNEGGQRRPRGLVVRVKPTKAQLFPDPDFDGLFRLLSTLRDSGLVKAPNVLWLEQDPGIVGAPFFVMDMLAARTPVSHPNYNAEGWLAEATPEQRKIVWTTAVEGLASVHRVPGELISFIGWPQYGATGEDQQIGYWDAYGQWCGFPMPDEVRALGEWVRKHRPNDPGIHLSWGDARIGNMMFGADFKLAGVLDWDQMSLADPRHDLSWWLYFDNVYTAGSGVPRPAGMGDRADTIGLWEDRTGLKAGDLTWYDAFMLYKLAMISMKTAVAAGGSDELAANRALGMLKPLRARIEF
jgi:aminoglycoside phosphotransferase (APT) family kinase protein